MSCYGAMFHYQKGFGGLKWQWRVKSWAELFDVDFIGLIPASHSPSYWYSCQPTVNSRPYQLIYLSGFPKNDFELVNHWKVQSWNLLTLICDQCSQLCPGRIESHQLSYQWNWLVIWDMAKLRINEPAIQVHHDDSGLHHDCLVLLLLIKGLNFKLHKSIFWWSFLFDPLRTN